MARDLAYLSSAWAATAHLWAVVTLKCAPSHSPELLTKELGKKELIVDVPKVCFA